MKMHLRLILSGVLLLVMAFVFAACSGGTQVEPSPVPTPTVVPTETPIPTQPPKPVLEIVGPSETKSLTMPDLMALPVTEGYAGIKSSTGKITPPVPFKGVALKDLAELIGGMDETSGFNVVAEDGYSITYSFDQIQNGSFIAYDPATGAELKNPVELTAILAYEMDGQPLDPKQDGILRLAIVSIELNQVTDGHWSVKWVNKLEVKSLGAEWVLQLDGGLSKPTDRASIESCGAPQCHAATWTDEKAQQWVGVPLWLFVGSVDDEIEHEGPAFNDALADVGYSVDVIASDGYTVTFEAARLKRNDNIIVAYKVNENQLPDEYFPLRLVGTDLQKNEMVGMITQIKVGIEPLPATAIPTDAPATAEPMAAGSLVITGAVNQELSFMEADLRAMEVLKITAEHPKKGKEDYEGISLNALLDLAGVKDGATTLVITAADGYTSEVSLEDVRSCADCLLGFTNTLEKFKMVMPNLPSGAWVKDVIRLEVK
jgi:DMSO/TMAO reductase YedYZ molybdopterin-dependent catalytic subunit